MDRLRHHIATELAFLSPSALAGAAAGKRLRLRLRSDVDRRLSDLVSALRTPTHPPYSSMIQRAIEKLNEGGGSSEKAISELIVREYENLPLGHEGILRLHLGKLCQSGEVMRTVDGRYCIRVVGGDVKNGVVGVELKNRKKWRRRKRGVSRASGVKDRGDEITKGGEIGEENGCSETKIEGQIEAQEVRIDGIDEEKKGVEEGEEVVAKLDQGNEEKNEDVKEQFEAEKQDMEVTEEHIQVYEKTEAVKQSEDEKQDMEVTEEQIHAYEKTEAVQEQSEAEKQDMEVTGGQIQMTSNKLNDEGGSNGEETLQAFMKAKAEANENKVYIKVGEQQEEQQLGISFEPNELQPEQTKVIERQEEEETQNGQQQGKAELNNKTIAASSVIEENIEAGKQQTEMIDEQQLGISSEPKEIQPQQAGVIEKQNQLEEVQKQNHEDCRGKQDKTEINHKTTESTPTATILLVGPICDDQQVNEVKQSARKKKLSVPQQQDLNQALLQRRKLRSYTWSNNPESATSTILESSLLSQQHDELQQQALHEGRDNQDRQRPPKLKRDENGNINTTTELPLDFYPHHEEQPLKRRSVQGKLPKPTPDADAIMEASNVQVQNEQQPNQAQVQRRVLRSHNKEPSVSQSTKPTTAFSSMPSKNQDMQQQQARGQGRPPKVKIDAGTNAESALSLAANNLKTESGVNAESVVLLASQHHEDDRQPQKQRGRGRPPKLKTAMEHNVGSALSSYLQDHKGEDEQPLNTYDQGRAFKRKVDVDLIAEEDEQPCKLHSQGRPPELKTPTDTDTGSALCLASQHHEEDVKQPPKHHGKGRPPNRIPSKYMLKKYGKYQFPSRGRGRPPKPKQDANSIEDMVLPSNTHLEKPKQGRGRPSKAK